ncbi:anti-sigma factor family protein [Pyxidicoccus xibeiensis]|uniref:anti-sigma factor family protein n=1 Tax=Pyxidicoccus xibeiensis TaxID=2906759 RepID=UPI0020A82F6A|nr:zf-HC2 domain-containing protein [Pyxidicoccus xibeiensis]MCP3139192.1 zf-HC2 domain-containing protein [Pyxidicoccus xibeiensis]
MKRDGGLGIFEIRDEGAPLPAEVRMYTCKDSINLLLEYLDGQMSDEEARHLKEHLTGCSPCEEFLRTYRATSGLCKKALAARMPEEVSSKLKEFLRSKIKSAS